MKDTIAPPSGGARPLQWRRMDWATIRRDQRRSRLRGAALLTAVYLGAWLLRGGLPDPWNAITFGAVLFVLGDPLHVLYGRDQWGFAGESWMRIPEASGGLDDVAARVEMAIGRLGLETKARTRSTHKRRYYTECVSWSLRGGIEVRAEVLAGRGNLGLRVRGYPRSAAEEFRRLKGVILQVFEQPQQANDPMDAVVAAVR